MRSISTLILFSTIFTFAYGQDKEIMEFWKYVQVNEETIYKATQVDQDVWNKLNIEVHKVNAGLNVLTGEKDQTGKKDLIISSNGNMDLFDECESVVKNSLDLQKFNPVALMPPAKEYLPFIFSDGLKEYTLNFDDVGVHCDDFTPDKLELIVFIRGSHLKFIQDDKTGYVYDFYYQMFCSMVMQVLGERKYALRIEKISFYPLSMIMPGSIKMTKLNKYIE